MKRTIYLTILLLFSLLSVSQNPQWKIYNIYNSGLPNNLVKDIAIDSKGSKWINSAYSYLAKLNFDDYHWEIFNSSNSPIQGGDLSRHAIDSHDNIWIATESGSLIKYDGSTWQTVNNGHRTLALAIDNFDTVWVASEYIDNHMGWWFNFLDKYYGTQDVGESSCMSFPIGDIFVDSHNDKWMSVLYNGLSLGNISGSSCFYYYIDWSALVGLYHSITSDKQNNIWVGTDENGLIKFDNSIISLYNTSNSGLPCNCVSTVGIDSLNNIWIGTCSAGLVKYDGTTWTIYDTSNSSIPSNFVKAIVIDSLNNKWIGTDAGLAVFNENGYVLSLSNYENKLKFDIYPNPVTNNITIETSEKSTIEILNIPGQTIKKFKIKDNIIDIDISDFASGVYIIRAQTEKGITTKKFIKE